MNLQAPLRYGHLHIQWFLRSQWHHCHLARPVDRSLWPTRVGRSDFQATPLTLAMETAALSLKYLKDMVWVSDFQTFSLAIGTCCMSSRTDFELMSGRCKIIVLSKIINCANLNCYCAIVLAVPVSMCDCIVEHYCLKAMRSISTIVPTLRTPRAGYAD